MIFLVVLLLLITLGALGLLFTVLTKLNPSEKRIREELKRMQTDMDTWAGELVPIDRKELELFSLSQIKNSIKKRLTTSGKGIYTTIFEEPIVAYSYKKYMGKKAHALLYCRTAEHEYAYWIRPKGVQVVIDNQLVGTYKDNGVLYGAESKKMIARINRDHKKISPILVGQREVASIVKALPPAAKDDLSARAFQFVRDDLTEDEEKLLLSISLLEMVQESVGEK